jgi:ferredoxin
MMSRRGLFRSLIGLKPTPAAATTEVHQAVADPAMLPPVPAATARRMRTFPVHRPPGAVAEIDFLERCTRCGDCIAACPHQAIVLAPVRMRGAEGTPIIVASESPCWHCPDTPCASVCGPKVLRGDYPQKMGTARIEVVDCLAWQRSFCTVCEERCPIPGAITLQDGKPSIDPVTCTGCGVCLSVCPAPRKAIMLMPETQRPGWKELRVANS